MPSEPKRKHQLTLTIGADTLEDLQNAMRQLADELHEPGTRSVGDGYTWGHSLEHKVDPVQTHEKFVEQMEGYLEAIKTLEG